MNGAAPHAFRRNGTLDEEIRNPMFSTATSIRLVGNFEHRRPFELAALAALHPQAQPVEEVPEIDREILVGRGIRQGHIAYVRDQTGYHLYDLRPRRSRS